MKKILFALFASLAVLCSCNQNNPDVIFGSGSSTTSGSSQKTIVAEAAFNYTVEQPLTLVIKDHSSGDYVTYDWGNGEKEKYDPGVTIKYRYAQAGEYVVKAIAHGTAGDKDEQHKSVSIRNPYVYVKGITYLAIRNQDRYYRFKLDDDGPWVIKTWASMSYTKDILYDAILPSTWIFNELPLLENIEKHEYYTLYVYSATSLNGKDTQCLKQKIYASDILKYPEYIEKINTDKDMKVRLLFHYK